MGKGMVAICPKCKDRIEFAPGESSACCDWKLQPSPPAIDWQARAEMAEARVGQWETWYISGQGSMRPDSLGRHRLVEIARTKDMVVNLASQIDRHNCYFCLGSDDPNGGHADHCELTIALNRLRELEAQA